MQEAPGGYPGKKTYDSKVQILQNRYPSEKNKLKGAPLASEWGWGVVGGVESFYFIFVTISYIVYQLIYLTIDYCTIFVKNLCRFIINRD